MMEAMPYATMQQNKKNSDWQSDSADISFRQCGICSAPWILRVLSTIKNVAIIIHSPAGCAASFVDFNYKYKMGLKKRGLSARNIPMVSTNLDERDVIYGIDKKLEEAINETIKRFNPKAIFIAASCGSGVTGYEIRPVVDRFTEKISTPLVTVVCEVYGAKKWGSGFDGGKYAIFKKIVKPTGHKKEFYNIIDFSGDDTMRKLLSETEIKWNFISCYEDYECLEKMADAKATFMITSDRFSKYIANYLEKEFQVPNIKLPVPCGFKSTDTCLQQIGKVVGEEYVFEKIISYQRKQYEPQIIDLRRKLKGMLALLVIKNKLNESKTISMLRDLGMQVLHDENGYVASAFSKEQVTNKNTSKGGYQFVQSVHEIKSDIMIAQHYNFTSWGAKIGQPTFWMEEEQEFFSYQGVLKFGQKIADVVDNQSFVQRLAGHVKLPYANL